MLTNLEVMKLLCGQRREGFNPSARLWIGNRNSDEMWAESEDGQWPKCPLPPEKE